MDTGKLFIDTQAFLFALSYVEPRTLGMFAALPIFNSQLVPPMIRFAAAAAVGALAAPPLMPAIQLHAHDVSLLFLVCKEAFVGFALGYALAIPFWAFEAVGFLIDNQRGASIAATLNPLTGNDSSPLGILFNQAFIVFFFTAGGFELVLGALYDSFRLWPVFDWSPSLNPDSIPLLLSQLDRLVRLALLYGAPAIVAMFLAEMGLGIVSRFVPQLQVFFLAMPIKSAIAILVLVMYASTVFEQGRESIEQMKEIVPFLHKEWNKDARGPR